MTWPVLSSILIFYAILIIVNVPAPLLGLAFDSNDEKRLWYAPPGFVIPVIWFMLFTLLGIARVKLLTSTQTEYVWFLYALAFLCATYAYYTIGLARLTNVSALWYGLTGNIVVIVFTGFTVYKLYPVSKAAAALTAPIIAWTAFATLIVIGELKLAKLI